jgi:hypothetical protein
MSDRFVVMHKKIEATIQEYGQSIQAVFSGEDDDAPPFMYTIGNYGHGLPEFIVVGATDRGPALNQLAEIQRDKGEALYGDITLAEGGLPVRLVDCSSHAVRDVLTVQVGQHYRTERYAVTQILLPDDEGRFPGDPECEEHYASFPLLADAGPTGAKA